MLFRPRKMLQASPSDGGGEEPAAVAAPPDAEPAAPAAAADASVPSAEPAAPAEPEGPYHTMTTPEGISVPCTKEDVDRALMYAMQSAQSQQAQAQPQSPALNEPDYQEPPTTEELQEKITSLEQQIGNAFRGMTNKQQFDRLAGDSPLLKTNAFLQKTIESEVGQLVTRQNMDVAKAFGIVEGNWKKNLAERDARVLGPKVEATANQTEAPGGGPAPTTGVHPADMKSKKGVQRAVEARFAKAEAEA